MKNTTCITTLLLCIFFLSSDAQPLRRFNSSSYNINDGLLQSHVWDMGFDAAGFVWLSYETGLQRYDGQHFINVPVQGHLPENRYITFLKSKNKLLWMAYATGISAYNGLTGKFELIFRNPLINEFSAIRPIGEDDSIVYFYCVNEFVIGINENTLQVVSKSQFPISTSSKDLYGLGFFHVSRAIVNHKALICYNSGTLILWDLQKNAASSITVIPKTKNISADEFCQIGNNYCLYTNQGNLLTYDLKNSVSSYPTNNLKNKNGSDVINFEPINDSIILTNIDNDLFLFNNKTMKFEQHIVNFQNQPFSHFDIALIRTDEFGNIYLITRSEGFVKLFASSFPISYYGSPEKESNFITSIEVDKKNNRVLAGTLNSGLLVFDTLQNLRKHLSQIGSMQKTKLLTISGITQISKNNYLLFPRVSEYCILWNASNDKMKKVSIRYQTKNGTFLPRRGHGIQYYCTKLKLNNGKKLIAIDGCLYEVDPSNTSAIKAFLQPNNIIKGLCLYKNDILMGTGEDINFLNQSDYTTIKTVHIPDCGEIRSIASKNNFIYAGCNRGLFVLNDEGKVVSIFSKANGLPDDYIYAVAIDNNENIWCSTNKGIVRINKDKTIFHLRKEDGLQENEFNTNAVAQEPDGELFFGGVNGINSFYPDQITRINDSPKIVLTNIRVNDEDIFRDSAIWAIKKIVLPNTSNNLYFEFTAQGSRNPEQYLYQYKIDELDKNWILSGAAQNARYVLQPGDYTFKVYAGKVYDRNPKNIKTIEIVIMPPFWQTWWFRIVAITIIVIFILLPIWQYNHRRYTKKLRAMQLQHELQLERERISRDLHDNLGAYAAAIAANVNKAQEKSEGIPANVLGELQQNSQSIVTQLNDTIWALNREAIALTSISDRFKIFIQKIQPSYPCIEIRVNESISNDILLSPVNALHLFRIMQEAVNNALRHSDCKHVLISIESNKDWSVNIIDDGKGMNEINKSISGNGLRNMQQRAAEAAWNIEWLDEKPNGTQLKITPASTTN